MHAALRCHALPVSCAAGVMRCCGGTNAFMQMVTIVDPHIKRDSDYKIFKVLQGAAGIFSFPQKYSQDPLAPAHLLPALPCSAGSGRPACELQHESRRFTASCAAARQQPHAGFPVLFYPLHI